MLFNSLDFALFAIVFFALWPAMRSSSNRRWSFLVVASFVFYGWWDWRFLFLILASGLLDFIVALSMQRWNAHRRFLLTLSIVGNLGILGAFKYAGFIAGNVNAVAGGLFDAPLNWSLDVALPVGISFYTFQSMSYTIDVYRGHLRPTSNPLHFFAYLSLFPQLVAGPIVRAGDLLPQLARTPVTTEESRWQGTTLIAWGLFKKVVVADTLATGVDRAFAFSPLPDSTVYWWVIMTMFAVQIYCDFSGYTDIARGLGKWMGLEFPENFRNPYSSASLREFWTRWHISLSTWFRDYVYIPLGGSRGSGFRAHVNLWITMLLSGLWHGASWTFVIWGAWHAAWLSLERVTRWPERLRTIAVLRHASLVGVFALVLVGWVFFRADSFTQATAVIGRMFTPSAPEWGFVHAHIGGKALLLTALILAIEALEYARRVSGRDLTQIGMVRLRLQPALIGIMVAASIYFRGPDNPFIYFQF